MPDVDYKPISEAEPIAEVVGMAQTVRRQTDGVGMRVGNTAEFTLIAPVAQPDGPAVFREKALKGQTEAAYWEGKLGTVKDVRICLINNDTQLLFAATYTDEFKPYVMDVIKFASPWIDYMFTGVGEGFPGLASPEAIPYIQKYQVEANVWYASNPDSTVRDVARAQNVSAKFNDLLDAAQS